MLDDVDVLAAPAVPLTAAPAGQETVTWPDGTTETVSDLAGLRIGLQLLGRPHSEPLLLRGEQVSERSLAVTGS
jgi:aspartyl-tRNA(Asn)/glutamyl-tRNA(Gln) amidotransferase subunit A